MRDAVLLRGRSPLEKLASIGSAATAAGRFVSDAAVLAFGRGNSAHLAEARMEARWGEFKQTVAGYNRDLHSSDVGTCWYTGTRLSIGAAQTLLGGELAGGARLIGKFGGLFSETKLATAETVYHATTSARNAQSVLKGVDERFFNSRDRFGKAFYVAEKPGTAIAEINHHEVIGTHEISKRSLD